MAVYLHGIRGDRSLQVISMIRKNLGDELGLAFIRSIGQHGLPSDHPLVEEVRKVLEANGLEWELREHD